MIAKHYLKHKISLARQALARLVDPNQPDGEHAAPSPDDLEVFLEKPLSLNEQRIQAVLAKVSAAGAKFVIDLGCGEGKLPRELIKDKAMIRPGRLLICHKQQPMENSVAEAVLLKRFRINPIHAV